MTASVVFRIARGIAPRPLEKPCRQPFSSLSVSLWLPVARIRQKMTYFDVQLSSERRGRGLHENSATCIEECIMSDINDADSYIELAADIVSAYVSNNAVSANELVTSAAREQGRGGDGG